MPAARIQVLLSIVSILFSTCTLVVYLVYSRHNYRTYSTIEPKNGTLNATSTSSVVISPVTYNIDKITVIVLTHQRNNDLQMILKNYCEMDDIIDRVIVVWNNVGEAVPDDLRSQNCSFQIVFKEQKINSLNNRFVKFPDIRTKC